MAPKIGLNIRSDVFTVPHPEDSSPQDHLAFYVIAILENGDTFMHEKSFTTIEFRVDEAEAKALALMTRIGAALEGGSWAGPFNGHWCSTYPQYGSRAYEQADRDGDNLLWERERDAEGESLAAYYTRE
jgi:hypothetical protein